MSFIELYPIFAGAIAGLASTFIKDWYSWQRIRTHETKRANAILSAHLDSFAKKCADLQYTKMEKIIMPSLDPDPEGINYEKIDGQTVADYLHLKSFVRDQDHRINYMQKIDRENTFPTEASYVVPWAIVLCGYSADQISQKLRKIANLQEPNLTGLDFDYREYLAENSRAALNYRKYD